MDFFTRICSNLLKKSLTDFCGVVNVNKIYLCLSLQKTLNWLVYENLLPLKKQACKPHSFEKICSSQQLVPPSLKKAYFSCPSTERANRGKQTGGKKTWD